MTCLVGVEDPDGAWLGADSAHTMGWRLTNNGDPKVFRLRPWLVVGGAGNPRLAQAVRHLLPNLPGAAATLDAAEPTAAWAVARFVPLVRAAAAEAGCLETEKGAVQLPGSSSLLLAVGPRVLVVWAHLGVELAARGYQATGSGDEYAVGSLHTSTHLAWPARARCRRALAAAAEHDASVAGPFRLLRAKPRPAP